MHADCQPILEQARQAASQGEWQQAYELYLQADAATSLAGTDLPVFARVAYTTGHLDLTITAWERLYALAMHEGNQLTSALAAVQTAMHLLFDSALMAPVRGWLRRADDLLEGSDETPVHAWRAVVRNYERTLSGDFVAAREWARQAVAIGNRLDPSAAAIGRVAEARALVLDGDVEQGLRLLDEAGVSLLAGEIIRWLAASSTARSFAASRAWPSSIWLSSGPMQWNGGTTASRSAASTVAAEFIVPRY